MKRRSALLYLFGLPFAGRVSAAGPEVNKVTLDPAAKQGTWDGWGVSLCWWAGVFGERADLADALFTTKAVRVGNELLPGLGLSIVRYNAGACASRKIGERAMKVSKIIQRYRQMEGFWLDDRSSDPASDSWDWSVDAKQRNMLKLAKERGVTHFELFANSPMWWMTRNDNPSGGPKFSDDNLAPAQEQNFAIYLASIARRAADDWGIPFTSVSPFNEPVSDWWFADCKQEGCHMSPAAQARVLPLLREELDKRGLSKLPISASEETYYDHAVRTWESFDAKTRALIGQVNVHGYQEAKGDRAKLQRLVHVEGGKRLWNSEYGDGDPSGLNMARNLHRDLAALKPTSWSYWQAVDGGGWGLIPGEMRRGNLRPANAKWHVLGHYTRNIAPGATMLTTGDEALIAAHDEKQRRLSLVFLNDGGEEREWRIDLSRFEGKGVKANGWITEPMGKSRYQAADAITWQGKVMVLRQPKQSVQTVLVNGV
ncbi:glycoside hydrolase [Haloferula sp. BvORR071]|uniref:glycoside hydrolase n=1 Tax=Haloferula sp. BvORR071 TaxID=1396141 RepID=UPI00054E949E|nr:glycoside hydrolase [Haloferula sp. BvORR071]